MRELRKWAWTAVAVAVAAASASAQQGTVTTTPTGRTSATLTGTGGITGGGAGTLGGNTYSSTTGGGGMSGGGGTGGTGGSEFSGTALLTTPVPPKLQAPTGQATSSLQKSNFLAGYYANPYYQGQISMQTNAQPGGFGMALYGTTNTGRVTSGTGGRTGAAGFGGAGGLNNNANQSGILIPLPVQIAYTARMQFPTPPVAPGKIVSEIRSVIDNTTAIANPKAVQIITDANNNVTIRGTVKDDDEARLIEGLVRITPGVGAIKNELAPQVATANR